MKKKYCSIAALLTALCMLSACADKQPAQPAATESTAAVSAEVSAAQSAAPESEAPAEASSGPLVIPGADSGEESQSPDAAAPAALTEDDFAVVISGGELTFDMTMDSVFELLGKDYQYAEAVSCAYDGMDKTFTYPDVEIYSWPDGDIDRVSEFLILTDACTTARGITVGSTRDEVTAAYGEGTAVGTMVEYQALGHLISFNFDNDAVTDIDFLKQAE